VSGGRAVHEANLADGQTVLSGYDIVCFALRAWDSTWKNNQQVMSRLAASNRILYVNPPRSLKAGLSAVRLATDGQAPVVLGRNLYVLQEPPLLPRWGRDHIAARLLNAAVDPMRLTYVRKAARRFGFRHPILWVYDPLAADATGRFDERLVVYYVIDNYDEYFPPTAAFWRSAMIRNHQRMLERADVVLAVTDSLHARCLEVNPNSFLVPNAADLKLFQTATDDFLPNLAEIPGPVIGYVGVIHSIIDFELLEYLARERPEWSLVLIGPLLSLLEEDRERFGRLVSYQNVYYVGFQPPDRLPTYIRRCDVTLMPYRLGPLTMHGDSLKLYEYLACGKPVVSTDIPSARRFRGLIEIARNREDFLRAIQRSLEEPSESKGARIREAELHSWDRRISDMGEILARHLGSGVASISRRGEVGG
jgi:glycosyltransferase involved in cell wall biosynthesis